jgi:hypothetical protein
MSFENFIEKQKQSQAYKDYEQIVGDLNKFRDLHPMSDNQGNEFRHYAGSARMAQMYDFIPSMLYGLGKEYDDLFNKNKGWADTQVDLKNNLRGAVTGSLVKNMPKNRLYEYLFERLSQ